MIEIRGPKDEHEAQQIRENYRYISDNLPIGSVVTPKVRINFCDGSCHIPGDRYVVTEDNKSYFVVNFSGYKVVK